MSPTGPSRSARFAWGAVIVILLGVVGLVTYALTHVSTPATVAKPATTSAGVVDALSAVPASVFDSVGASAPGVALVPPRFLSGQPALTFDGRPDVLFIGAEYCPFCAAERWPLVVALARFGHFTVLHDAVSTEQSVFPGTATFSFVGTEYSSPYLDFTGVELYSDEIGADGSFTRLARLTPAQAALITKYGSGSPDGTSPFVDVAGRMVTTTSAFSPSLLGGLSQAQIASALSVQPTATGTSTSQPPTPPVGAAVIAAANQLTVGICVATGQQPGSVCHSTGVRDTADALGVPSSVG